VLTNRTAEVYGLRDLSLYEPFEITIFLINFKNFYRLQSVPTAFGTHPAGALS
jgi:hypothetical protein